MGEVDKRRMCSNCRAFITSDDKICPYCDAKVGSRAIDRRSPADAAGGLIPHARFTTTVILLINFGLYAATVLYSMRVTGSQDVMGVNVRTLVSFGSMLPLDRIDGQWWRLITAGFLHGGVFHILMNSWIIFDLGTQVEEIYGTSRYLVLYFVTTIAGFFASGWWTASVSVGASAALFGLIGAMIALGVRQRHTPTGAAMRGHYTQWAIWGLAMGLLPGFSIDNAAHIGGLASGFVLGYAIGTPRLFEHWTDKAWRIAATVCVALTVLAFADMFVYLTSS